jgi:hypothetical protein
MQTQIDTLQKEKSDLFELNKELNTRIAYLTGLTGDDVDELHQKAIIADQDVVREKLKYKQLCISLQKGLFFSFFWISLYSNYIFQTFIG